MRAIDKRERLDALWRLLQTTHEEAPVTAADLAKALSVSERTIHYDLDALVETAKERGRQLERRARRGIWLAAYDPRAGSITSDEATSDARILSPKERRDTLLYRLITGEEQTIDALAEKVDVSRTTLLADLKSVQDFLAARGLHYRSKRGQGVWVAGEELAIRDALIHIFSRPLYDFRKFSDDGDVEGQSGRLFRMYVGDLDVERLSEEFFRMVSEVSLTGSDADLNRMLVAFVIFLLRIRQGHIIEGLPTREKEAPQDAAPGLQSTAEKLAALLEREAGTRLPKGETDALFAELLHSRLRLAADAANVEVRAFELAKAFVADAEVWLGDVYQDDAELLHTLALHLQPAIERARYGITFTNPLLPDIRDAYRDLFRIAERAASRLEERTGLAFSPDEIGYLTIHLGAARERKRRMHRSRLSVLLVCGSGQGTANLLAMTLEKHLAYLSITRKMSFYELDEEAAKDVDLILTTVPLEHDTLPVLKVSPILREAELKVIESQIAYCLEKKIEKREARGTHGEEGARLLQLLTDDVVELDAAPRDWQEAVRRAGELLERSGAATTAYTAGMIRMIERLGPYMMTAPGVLMPHAGPGDGARRVAVSFVRLKRPLRVGNGTAACETDLIFAFTAVNETSHVSLIRDLWTLFQDEARLHAIRRAGSKEEIRTILGELYARDG